jgi:cyclopropane-fatty-acyl-phospholipid synthase
MTAATVAIRAIETFGLPDPATRLGVELLVGRARRKLEAGAGPDEAAFAAAMAERPIAVHTDAANAQHYELPPEFFGRALGPRRKYSCCFYERSESTLADAEIAALERSAAIADLRDGQSILELGCGWGSLTLFMAERFPRARITAVSNSAPQRLHIQAEARARRLENVRVLTADMNRFAPDETYDRVVSIEMFEHMSNWRALLERIRGWLEPDGRLYLHVFSHRARPYRFEHEDRSDWIAQHFFTGGVMPSHGLIRRFPDCFAVEEEARWSGTHYERTALDWLERYDAERAAIEPILESVYGDQASVWRRRWRLFFLATAGLFGHAKGEEWGVSHYRLRPAVP